MCIAGSEQVGLVLEQRGVLLQNAAEVRLEGGRRGLHRLKLLLQRRDLVPGVRGDLLRVGLGLAHGGVGLGLVFRAGGNTGGTDIVAQITAAHTSLSTGMASLVADAAVIAVSVPVFGIENALYATIAMYLGTRVLDMVIDGFNTQRAAYVISDRHDEVKAHVFSDLDRGCTELLARGGYTGKERPVLLVVLTRSEMTYLRRIVADIDPSATIIVSKIHEAFGNGFTSLSGTN